MVRFWKHEKCIEAESACEVYSKKLYRDEKRNDWRMLWNWKKIKGWVTISFFKIARMNEWWSCEMKVSRRIACYGASLRTNRVSIPLTMSLFLLVIFLLNPHSLCFFVLSWKIDCGQATFFCFLQPERKKKKEYSLSIVFIFDSFNWQKKAEKIDEITK